MVTNDSSLGEDLGELWDTAKDAGKSVGQKLGFIEEDLIPGNPDAARAIADDLLALAGAFERAGEGFKRINLGGWRGAAADNASSYVQQSPPKWFAAADAFDKAGKAVAEYAEILAEQQGKAARAKEALDKATEEAEAAAERYNEAAAAAADGAGPDPGPWQDPTAQTRQQAQADIEAAQRAVQEADARAARAVTEAAQQAPAEPGRLEKLKREAGDLLQGMGRAIGGVAEGAGSAVVDLYKTVRAVTPFDPYNITHPAAFAETATTLAAGLIGVAQNPYQGAKTILDIDGWRENPAKSLGSLIPDAVASLAGGAGVAGKAARGVGRVAGEVDELAGIARHADDIARAERVVPDSHISHLPHTPDNVPGASHPSSTGWQHSDTPTSFGQSEQPFGSYPSEHEFGPKGTEWEPPEKPKVEGNPPPPEPDHDFPEGSWLDHGDGATDPREEWDDIVEDKPDSTPVVDKSEAINRLLRQAEDVREAMKTASPLEKKYLQSELESIRAEIRKLGG
ncbi:putative T7SS-secreted protein [Saccharopolyspora rectivirgula]|uniref:putative T7SS-secreted protein n=1 Tax=Saccharopolyspora rectivirgula TaxID=28042 RepID=UPI002409421C|nr:hypothetical protein [Saccharopolyspora rectivirgula]